MDEGVFDQPVRVVGNARGNMFRNVTTTFEAAKFLLDDWPGNPDTQKHLAARKACIAVLQGIKEARVARKAFEVAADEANILVERNDPGSLVSEGPTLRPRPRRKLKRDT